MRNLFSIAVAIIAVVSSAQAKTKTSSILPANFDVPNVLVDIVSDVYVQSDTFRAQCDRLGRATNMQVSLRLDSRIRPSCRAFTVITRKDGILCAEVHLPPSIEMAELLGHEFEHILEQLEHVNLRVLAHVRGSGVREIDFDLFETERAQRTGIIVAKEMRLRQERPSAD
jgi:hypothetical protein